MITEEHSNRALTFHGGTVPGNFCAPEASMPSRPEPHSFTAFRKSSGNSGLGYCRLPSPVLTASLLLSCPARSDMLKFRASFHIAEVNW